MGLLRGRKDEGWQAFAKGFEYVDLQPEPYLLRGQEHFLARRYRDTAIESASCPAVKDALRHRLRNA